MFTGIVRAVGRVAEKAGGRLAIESAELAPGLQIGGSVAVNGACLTVTQVEGHVFFADVVPETFRRTNLGALLIGSAVNLETPVTLQQPLDGHLVQGHVDGTAAVIDTRDVELGREVTFQLPADLARFVAEKGSIAVDGTSLTVAGVTDESFAVALIPTTLAGTVARHYRPGTVVNLEVDLLARYAERLVRASTPSG